MIDWIATDDLAAHAKRTTIIVDDLRQLVKILCHQGCDLIRPLTNW